MGWLLISALRGACIVAALAGSGLWVRSYYAADTYDWRVQPERGGFSLVHTRVVSTTPGRVSFYERCAFT